METIFCPKCGQDYVLDSYQEGAQVECAKCGHSFSLKKGAQKSPAPSTKAAKPKKTKTDEWGYSQPVLCNLFNAFGILGAVGAALILWGVFANGGKGGDDAILPFILCLSDCLVCFAASKVIAYIAEIRHHSVKQSEMQKEMLELLRKR